MAPGSKTTILPPVMAPGSKTTILPPVMAPGSKTTILPPVMAPGSKTTILPPVMAPGSKTTIRRITPCIVSLAWFICYQGHLTLLPSGVRVGKASIYAGGEGGHRRVLISEVVGTWLCPCGSSRCRVHPHSSAHAPTRPDPFPAPPTAVTSVPSAPNPPQPLGKPGGSGLTLEYCERGSSNKEPTWQTQTVAFMHQANEVIAAWHQAISGLLHGLRQRPRRVLVVINPVGGKKQASSVYKRKVMPLFRRAEVETRVVKTKYRGHGQELVEDEVNLEGVDGVVAVGGDGLVNEVVMGLLLVACRRAGINPHDPEVQMPTTHLRLGIIPGGSTDALCYSTHGTSDVVTAALHIIMGDSRQVDVASVHRDDQLLNVATSMVSYGYFGDLLRTSERWRKLGPTRYLLAGVLQLLRNRFYEGQLQVRTPAAPLAQPYDVNICSDRCSVCTKAAMCTPSPGEWLQFTGRWSIVTSALTSCACRLSPGGVSPAAHLGDGCMDLILVAGSSRRHTLSYLFRTAFTGNALSLQHVTFHRAQEMVFTPKAGAAESSWNCDGELLTEPRVRLRMHCQRVGLYTRGVEAAPEDPSKTPAPVKRAAV
ncbi:Ceramide kinase [Chionoecetes opilio]|uniref:Ceramide kinase n=1 Tax=Chionoecetes opilio TaxID=41210 RepID=A0A8J8WAA7_CHIOP|nr:Ceramide kinase [Chionoecetes opilio]